MNEVNTSLVDLFFPCTVKLCQLKQRWHELDGYNDCYTTTSDCASNFTEIGKLMSLDIHRCDFFKGRSPNYSFQGNRSRKKCFVYLILLELYGGATTTIRQTSGFLPIQLQLWFEWPDSMPVVCHTQYQRSELEISTYQPLQQLLCYHIQIWIVHLFPILFHFLSISCSHWSLMLIIIQFWSNDTASQDRINNSELFDDFLTNSLFQYRENQDVLYIFHSNIQPRRVENSNNRWILINVQVSTSHTFSMSQPLIGWCRSSIQTEYPIYVTMSMSILICLQRLKINMILQYALKTIS